MRTRLLFGVVLVAAICVVAAPDAPITRNPIPEPIVKHGLAVEIKDLARLPGFRNAHRLSWDTDGTMFADDIGMDSIEEVNIVHNGGNYGWMKREGYFSHTLSRAPHSSDTGPGIPAPLKPPPPENAGRHRLPDGHVVRCRAVLGGLHHEYWLEKRPA